MNTKICCSCKKEKPIEEFVKDNRKKMDILLYVKNVSIKEITNVIRF